MSIINVGDIKALLRANGITATKQILTEFNKWTPDQNNLAPYARVTPHEIERNDYYSLWSFNIDIPAGLTNDVIAAWVVPETLEVGSLQVAEFQGVILRDSVSPNNSLSLVLRYIPKGETTAQPTNFTLSAPWTTGTVQKDTTGPLTLKPGDTLLVQATNSDVVDPMQITVIFTSSLLG